MSVSENLKNAVRERNLPDVRGSLWSCLMFDVGMSGKYQESLDYVLANGISADELYEADDAAEFDITPTEANFDKIVGLLKVNFSFRKLEALRRIGVVLVPPKKSAHEKPPRGSEVPPRRGRSQSGGNSGNSHSKAIAIAAATVVVVILVAGTYGVWRIFR